MRSAHEFARTWLPVLFWAGLIFFVSDQPKEAIPAFASVDLLVKKGGHVLAYTILSLLLWRAGLGPGMTIAVAFAYAISDEYHQTFVPGRTGRVFDVVIDSVGIMIGVGLHHYLARQRELQ